MAQSNSTKTATISSTIDDSNPMNNRLILNFSNGDFLEIRMSDLTPELATMAMMHGLKQKLVDAAAISRNPETGKSATVQDKYEAVAEVHARLLAGQWNAPREGGGNAGGLLFRALVQMFDGKKTSAEVREWLDGKSKDEQAALRKNPKIAAIIAELQAAKVDSSIDTDSMLDELNDE